MDSHKLRVAVITIVTAIASGAAMAVMEYVVDPLHFNWLDATALKRVGVVAIGGAAVGVFNLLRKLPRDPATWQRREDLPQLAKAAEKKGLVASGTSKRIPQVPARKVDDGTER